MASRLKYSAMLLAACVVAALLIQSWEPSYYGRYQTDRMEVRIAKTLELNAAHRLHREYMLGDSLRVRMSAESENVVVEQSQRSRMDPELLRRAVEDQLADVTKPRARIGVFLHDASAGIYTGSSATLFAGDPLYFTGTDANGPYCFAAESQTVSQQHQKGMKRFDIGPCVFWAKYGVPGAGVERWLRQGGYHFAAAPARRLWTDQIQERGLFGSRGYDGPGAHGVACRSGDASRCVQAVSHPYRTDGMAYAAYAPTTMHRYRAGPEFGEDRTMLAHVEAEFGAEKFAQFWSSDADLEPAFAAAFGEPVDRWIMRWARKYYGDAIRSPRIPVGSIALSLALIAALVGASVSITHFREIE